MKKLKESLIKSAQYGDIDALDIIIKEFSISAYYYAVKALNDHDDAEDFVQIALKRMVENIHKYDKKKSCFSIFCQTIVEHEFNKFIRSIKRYQSRVVNDEDSVYTICDFDHTSNTEKLMLSDLEIYIGEELYKVLYYKIGLCYTFEQMSKIFNCSLSTIKRKYDEAMKEAKQYIKGTTMKKNIKELIKQDINNSYKVEYDLNELHDSFVPKTYSKNEVHISKKRLVLYFILVCVLGVFIGALRLGYFNANSQMITNELREFVYDEYGCKIQDIDLWYSLKIDEDNTLYIFYKNIKSNSKINNAYIYMYKTKNNYDNMFIITNNFKIKIENNSFGVLTEKDSNDPNQTIEFSIEINGKIKDFLLN